MTNIKINSLNKEVPPVSSNPWWTQLPWLPTSSRNKIVFQFVHHWLQFSVPREEAKAHFTLSPFEQILILVSYWPHSSQSQSSTSVNFNGFKRTNIRSKLYTYRIQLSRVQKSVKHTINTFALYESQSHSQLSMKCL